MFAQFVCDCYPSNCYLFPTHSFIFTQKDLPSALVHTSLLYPQDPFIYTLIFNIHQSHLFLYLHRFINVCQAMSTSSFYLDFMVTFLREPENIQTNVAMCRSHDSIASDPDFFYGKRDPTLRLTERTCTQCSGTNVATCDYDTGSTTTW